MSHNRKAPVRSQAEAQAMAEANVGLVFMVANRLAEHFGRTSDDLIAYGYCGLLRACELYEPDRGFAFSTYAVQRITGSIHDGIRRENPWSERMDKDRNKLRRTLEEMRWGGEEPAECDVASALGWTVEKVRSIRSLIEARPMPHEDLVLACDALMRPCQ